MAVETARIECPPGVYTLISDGLANLSFVPPSTAGGKMILGSTQPIPAATNYRTCRGGEPVELGSLGSAKVYWMPNDSTQTLEVIRG